MPLKKCQKDGKPGYKWGDDGTCYPYTANDKSSRERAKERADRQGRAIEASKRK